MSDRQRAREVAPDHVEIDRTRKIGQVDTERDRRIAARYPLQRQIMIIASVVMKLDRQMPNESIIGAHSPAYIQASERNQAGAFLNFLAEYETAAVALKSHIAKSSTDPRSVTPSDPKWWPKESDHVKA